MTELIVAELMYLQWLDPKEPIYIYINSTGTTRDDGETVSFENIVNILDHFHCKFSFQWTMLTKQVGMESEGFAIYDSLMQLKNEVTFTFE